MPVIWAILRRDLIAAFTTPLAWLVIACWAFVTNFVFAKTLYDVHGSEGADQPLFVSVLSLGVAFLSLLAPALTMNSFAAEQSQGTMQLLLTVPIREAHLVLGKFAAALALLAALAAVTLVQPVVLAFVSAVHWPHLVAGYLGLLLACSLFAALGVWISLIVDSPVAAYVLTFGAIMVLILVGAGDETGYLHPLAAAIGLANRTRGFFAGQIRLGDVAFFLAGTGLFLTLAHAALCARRING